MSDPTISLDEDAIRKERPDLVLKTLEDTLNALLDDYSRCTTPSLCA